MNNFILPLLMGAPQGAVEGAAPNPLSSFLPIIAIIAIFYFLIIRPKSKERKETEKMLSAIKKGDRIVTIGGLYGTIQTVRDTTVIIKADDNVKLEFLRTAISRVITAAPVKEEKAEDENDEKEKSEGQTGEAGV